MQFTQVRQWLTSLISRIKSDPRVGRAEPELVDAELPNLGPDPVCYGFDVSHHQGAVPFKVLADLGYTFCFLKSTEGLTHRDTKFVTYVRSAMAAGIIWGAYHFARIRGEPGSLYRLGQEQAKHMESTIRAALRTETMMLPPVLDIEWHDSLTAMKPTPDDMGRFISGFADHMKSIGFPRIIIYTGPNFYKQYIRRPYTDHLLWLVSGYNGKMYPKDSRTILGWKAAFYQFTNRQPIPRLSSDKRRFMDANVFYGSVDTLKSILGRITPTG